MIKIVREDITTATDCVIPHGVNCQGRMASGVAKAIKEKWPLVYDDFMYRPTGKDMLGSLTAINVSEDITVFNCYTQEFYGRDGKRYASLWAVERTLREVFQYAAFMKKKICMPKIGCGLGGLDWDTEVKPIVEKLSTLNEVNVYVYEI